jgi:hypothetical protein
VLHAGFYGLKQTVDGSPAVSPRDQYVAVFAEQEVPVQLPISTSDSNKRSSNGDSSSSSSSSSGGSQTIVATYDFFCGPVSDLAYYLAHLFVSLWMPNSLKTASINNPWLFQQLKTATAWVIQGVNGLVNIQYGLLNGFRAVPPLNVITAIVKVGS